MKNLIIIFIIIISISCTNFSVIPSDCNNLKEYKECQTDLCSFFIDNGCYVHQINGFYIVSSNQVPTTENGFDPSPLELFDHSIKLFSSFLDQDNDGQIDEIYLNLNYMFCWSYISQYIGIKFNL